MHDEILSFDGVALSRDGINDILADIDWTISRGEHWFVMGNNGAGKTTLIEIAGGYLWPSRGRVSVLGERFGSTHMQQLRLRIGYVSSWVSKRISEELSVRDAVASGLNAGVGHWLETEAHIAQIRAQMHFFNLDRYEHTPIGVLSSGERIRVMLARALVSRPELLILDEPFANLDINGRYMLMRFFDKIAAKPHAPGMVLVTHHFEELPPCFTHGLFLKNGRVAAKGERLTVLAPAVVASAFDIPQDLATRLVDRR
jgi:iron complex transport system ATP-binding protein